MLNIGKSENNYDSGQKTLIGKIIGYIRMCMYLICGMKENKYKQPKFLENCAEDFVYYRIVWLADEGPFN